MRDKSNDIPIGGQLSPQSVAAAGNATGATYVDCRTAAWWVMMASIGAGGGTATFKWRQATDSSGTSAKDVSGSPGSATKAISAANTSGIIDLDPQALDLANGFYFIAPRVDVAGGAGTLCGALAVACDPHYAT